MIIAIIPARKNSKRIKNKNIKKFNDKSMIYWTISKLKKFKIINKILVTSDSDLILKKAKKFKADECLKRPNYLATGKATTKDVIVHGIKYLKRKNIFPSLILCVYPCTPFLRLNDISKAIKLVKQNKKRFVSAVTAYNHPIQRSFNMTKNNKIINQKKKNIKTNTQKFKLNFYDCGQFYLSAPETWSKQNHLENYYGVKIPSWRAIDIDNNDDWKRAELLSKII